MGGIIKKTNFQAKIIVLSGKSEVHTLFVEVIYKYYSYAWKDHLKKNLGGWERTLQICESIELRLTAKLACKFLKDDFCNLIVLASLIVFIKKSSFPSIWSMEVKP